MAKGVRPPTGPGGSALGRAPGRVTQSQRGRPGFPPPDEPQPPEELEEHSSRMAPKDGLSSAGAVTSVVRTPFLLWWFPGILVAVMLATLILGVATVASPLFLSSASTAAIRQITATSTNVPALSLSTYWRIAEDEADFRDEKLTALTGRIGELGRPVETVTGGRQSLTNPIAPKASGPDTVLSYRTGAQ